MTTNNMTNTLGPLTDGQVVIGSSIGIPTAATLTAGANVTITNGHNSISIAATGGATDPLTTQGDLWGWSTTDARVPAGSAQQILYTSPGNVATSATTLAYDYIRPTPIYSSSVFSDFCNSTNTAENVPSSFTSGTGSVVNKGDTNFNSGTTNGVLAIQTGTTTTGTAGENLCSGANIFFSNGQIIFETAIELPILSDGTDTYGVQWGLNGSGTGSNFSPSSGVYFYYSSTINSGQFQCISSSAGTATLNTSFTVVAATWYRLKFIINSAGTLITFYVNDVSQGTLNTHIPLTTGCVSYAQILKSAGTTSRTCNIDYLWYSKDFAAAR